MIVSTTRAAKSSLPIWCYMYFKNVIIKN